MTNGGSPRGLLSLASAIRDLPSVLSHPSPCFLSLLQNVLRGMARSRAASLLLPRASARASSRRWRSKARTSASPSSSTSGSAPAAAHDSGGRRPRPRRRRRRAGPRPEPAPGGLAHLGRQVVAGQRRAVGQDDRALDDVLELADVARPVVRDQGLDGLLVEVRDRLADSAGRAGPGSGRPARRCPPSARGATGRGG